MTCCTFQANKNPESRASRVAMGPSLAAAVCIMVCAVASALPLAKFFSFRYAAPVFLLARSTPTSFDPISVRSSTAADTKRGDADEQEDNIYDAGDDSDDSDEWGIIHAPHAEQSRPSKVQLVATVHDVDVTLTLAVSARCRSPPGLRIQRVRATWAFSAATESTLCSRRPLQFAQAPMFAVDLVTLAQFEAYVADRLDVAARRHDQYIMGSRLCWAPQLSIGASATNAGPVKSSTPRLVNTADPPVASHPEQATVKPAKRPRARLASVKPRYLNYEQSASYSSKRKANIERRRALQSAQHRLSKDLRFADIS
jgi:hypothetical protein